MSTYDRTNQPTHAYTHIQYTKRHTHLTSLASKWRSGNVSFIHSPSDDGGWGGWGVGTRLGRWLSESSMRFHVRKLLRCSLNGFGNLIHNSGVVPNKLWRETRMGLSIEWFRGLTDVNDASIFVIKYVANHCQCLFYSKNHKRFYIIFLSKRKTRSKGILQLDIEEENQLIYHFVFCTLKYNFLI